MISRRIRRSPEHDDYRRLARYIADASHGGEKCLLSWCAGCWSGDDEYELAIGEVAATQALNARTTREKTYHLMISFRPEDEGKLTPEIFRAIELEFAQALGFEEHQRHCGVHRNTDNIHIHIAYNQIHLERRTRHDVSRHVRLETVSAKVGKNKGPILEMARFLLVRFLDHGLGGFVAVFWGVYGKGDRASWIISMSEGSSLSTSIIRAFCIVKF